MFGTELHRPRTVGVEEELLLVDPRSGAPAAVVDSVLSIAAPSVLNEPEGTPPTHPQLELEAKQEQIEVVSPPSRTLDEVAQVLAAGRRLVDDSASELGYRSVALATSALPVASRVARKPRYEAMRERFAIMMKEQLTCGFHVHVGIDSEEEGVAVLDRIRPWLPVLLALTCNSPMWGGSDSGYASYRYQMWSRWPSTGPYEVFGSAANYRQMLDSLIATGVLMDRGMVYFDARLCDHYPTIEVRVADVCMDVEHAVAVVGIVRALVDTAAEEWRSGFVPEPIPASLLKLAMWSASRYGIEGSLVNPVLGEACDARVAVDALLAHVEHALVMSGDLARVREAVDAIFVSGAGAARQRRVLRATGSARAVVKDAIDVTNRAQVSPVQALT